VALSPSLAKLFRAGAARLKRTAKARELTRRKSAMGFQRLRLCQGKLAVPGGTRSGAVETIVARAERRAVGEDGP